MAAEEKIVCSICGETEAARWVPCRYREGWICISCCKHRCGQYSPKLLPNGTNCKMTSRPKNFYTYISDSAVVEIFRQKFRFVSADKAKEMFKETEQRYKNCTDVKVRADMRAQLAALEQIISEGRQCRLS